MIAATGLMLFYSSAAIEKFLTLSVGYLYLVYIVFVVWSLVAFGDRIEANFAAVPLGGQLVQGRRHLRRLQRRHDSCRPVLHPPPDTRREALVAGALAGPLGMLPGVLFYIAMMGYYHEIGAEALPSAFLLAKLHAPWFEWAFQIAVLLDAGRHGRRAAARDQRTRGGRVRRAATTHAAPAASCARRRGDGRVGVRSSAVGLVDLIAKGYGLLTYAFIVLLIVPVLTIGVWRIRRSPVEPVTAAP